MKKGYRLCFSLFVILIALRHLAFGLRHSDQNASEKISINDDPVRKYPWIENSEIDDGLVRRILANGIKRKRALNDADEIPEDIDDFLQQPSNGYDVQTSLPPWLLRFLASNLYEKRNENRVMTPRMGRDIEDDLECRQSRPPFAPRLGKKSLPFKPRLGRQAYDEIKC